MGSLPRDNNRVTAIGGVSNTDGTVIPVYVDSTTHRLLADIAVTGAELAARFQTDTFTSTNNQTVFTASTTVVGDFFVTINGSVQTPSTDYSVTGNTLTLSSGIPSGNIVVWKYIK